MKFAILNKDPLKDYRKACKITQGIELSDSDSWKPENETEFWIKQIVANHSTIRSIRFRLTASAPRSVIMQLIRATKGHPQPYVQSSRPDWCGKERSSNPYEEKLFIMDFTAEAFVELCKQRLCERTEKRTNQFVWELVDELRACDVPFFKAVGYCCHPNCWWHGGKCPEIKACNERISKLSDVIINQYREDEV